MVELCNFDDSVLIFANSAATPFPRYVSFRAYRFFGVILRKRVAKKYQFNPDRVPAPSANIAVGANRWPNIGRVCRRISDSIGYFILGAATPTPDTHMPSRNPPGGNSGRNGAAGFIALAKRLTANI